MRDPHGYKDYDYAHGPEMYSPMIRLAQAYVPYQPYRCFFQLPVGWSKGTIFEELYRPYKRKRR